MIRLEWLVAVAVHDVNARQRAAGERSLKWLILVFVLLRLLLLLLLVPLMLAVRLLLAVLVRHLSLADVA